MSYRNLQYRNGLVTRNSCPQHVHFQEPRTRDDITSNTTTITAIIAAQLNQPLRVPSEELTLDSLNEGDLQYKAEERKATAFSPLYWPDGDDGLPLVPYVVVNLSA
ncbi:hypothetical protein E2C01_001351 [Portunus trituberculatus]|uniref:Uncharacterized protein n=1 Tax=Portunus trituberculatus TaxID=210409 RepID=A0A5B7CGY7_PORTR|nr:hypothetical protein [Portunus trituberculatus]